MTGSPVLLYRLWLTDIKTYEVSKTSQVFLRQVHFQIQKPLHKYQLQIKKLFLLYAER